MTTITVKVDEENNAERWWQEVRAAYPEIAAALSRGNAAVVTEETYDALAALPGFADGPEYAPEALIRCGDVGD